MTDKKMIINFIERHFELCFDDIGIMIVDKKSNRNKYNSNGLYSMIKTIFGVWYDSAIQPDEIAKMWFDSRSKVIIADLDGFLMNSIVDLFCNEFIVKSPLGEPLDIEKLCKHFNTINRNFIETYFIRWLNYEKNTLTIKHLNQELIEYEVRLGMTDWFVVDKKRKNHYRKNFKRKIFMG